MSSYLREYSVHLDRFAGEDRLVFESPFRLRFLWSCFGGVGTLMESLRVPFYEVYGVHDLRSVSPLTPLSVWLQMLKLRFECKFDSVG